ncbi:putative histone deacetylase (HDAC) interacting [Lyophyllum shimeji]|uniref:Histone deacetylase (HDAC) interacting n=1 Tax=Lyophyllum shimeji TaxID=47721 RepID=A0A9P3PGT4_LYOSH|nr:putative histone deacetylase (HDAC) interacting [Lyophyllum shimeji]
MEARVRRALVSTAGFLFASVGFSLSVVSVLFALLISPFADSTRPPPSVATTLEKRRARQSPGSDRLRSEVSSTSSLAPSTSKQTETVPNVAIGVNDDHIKASPSTPAPSDTRHTDDTLRPSLKRKPTAITFVQDLHTTSLPTSSSRPSHGASPERILIPSESEEGRSSGFKFSNLKPLWGEKRPKQRLQHASSSPHLTSKPPLPAPTSDGPRKPPPLGKKRSKPLRNETGDPATPRSASCPTTEVAENKQVEKKKSQTLRTQPYEAPYFFPPPVPPIPHTEAIKRRTPSRSRTLPPRHRSASPSPTPRSERPTRPKGPMDVDAAIISPAHPLPPFPVSGLAQPPDLPTSSQQPRNPLAQPDPQPSPAQQDSLQLPKPAQPPYPTGPDILVSHSDTPDMKPRTPKPSTPRPSTGDSPAGAQKSPEVGRALNVTDALSYLDAVKVQFQDKPEVYNRFLDIMKDFKSQVIDTPGVIQRVSRLFNGNPYLIQGFNTFLPVGYRIDISADPTDPNTITVTTPSGTTTQNTNVPRSHVGTPTFPGAAPAIPPHIAGPSSRSHTPHAFHLHGAQPPFDPTFSPGFQNPQTTAAASVLGNMNGSNGKAVETQPAGEFNHAIHYLNKIKARYSEDANTYKQFLDILQTYQKEQRHLQDYAYQSQVYAQVQILFKDAPDLLAEFKDFLPDAVAAAHGPGPAILPQPAKGPGMVPAWTPAEIQSSSPADKGVKKVAVPSKRKKRAVEKEPTPVPPAKLAPSRAKKVKHHHKPDSASTTFSPLVQPSSPQVAPLHVHAPAPSMQPSPLPTTHTIQTQISTHAVGTLGSTSADKLLFFDRAKKSLESREMYEDFLKLLNLFSKEIIEIKTLIERAGVFLGDGELLSEFKELVGWDERLENVENGPPGSIRTGPPEALSALPADDGEGPSYRRLPDSEIRLACSGRDELCRSVLNDEWVSHPTWASEEAGFISHKKNSFEEALHKSEEERFEYHVQLEALARTIAVLEPLSARIEEMTSEERAVFKLKPDFGGLSKSIYHRMIKKVYGRDSGQEVIQALQDCPSVAVPVVLARLRQKDEEWRRMQREWSRTWREVDSKNFYKSLDHQGISFKQNDKKNITAKHFVTDIESIKNQQLEAWEDAGVASFARGSVGHQLEYAFHDTSALLDSLKMVYSFLDRSQAHYSSQERRSVEKFLRAFIPLLCMYPVAEFNAACGPLEGAHDEEVSIELNGHFEGTKSGRRSAGSTHSVHSTGVVASDLRKKLLRTAQEKATGKATPTASRDTSPSPGHPSPLSRTGDLHDSPEDIWIAEAGADSFAQNLAPAADSERPFFANTTFYTLLRLLQLLYSRLLMCKEIGAQHAAEKHASLLANRVAVELGLDEPNGPSAVLEQTIEALGDRGASENANVVYMYLLNACEKLFDGDMDQATFEEHMRWFFGNKAYHLFTLDKLITALVKQVQTILSDNRCQELWRLLQSAQSSEVITNHDVVRYRREAERHVGQDDHLYRLQWVRELKSVRVYLVGPDDPSMDSDGTAVSRWRGYVDSYVMSYPTEWVPIGRKGLVWRFIGGNVLVIDHALFYFIYRTLRMEDGTAPFTRQTKIRIALPSYKLVYESGAEDFAWRRRGPGEEQKLLVRARGREEERRKSVFLV